MKTSTASKLPATKSFIDCLKVDAPLSPAERSELSKWEDVIENGWDTFVNLGIGFARIRDAKLYRETHPTFERYCRERWQYGKSQAYYLIGAAAVVKNLSTIVDKPLPTHESQIRPLLGLSQDQAVEAWKEAVKNSDGNVTAKIVKHAAEKFRPKASKAARKRQRAEAISPAEAKVAISLVESAELALRTDKDVKHALTILGKIRNMFVRFSVTPKGS